MWVNEESTIKLPCIVNYLGIREHLCTYVSVFWGFLRIMGVTLNFIFSDGFVIIWKKGDNFLAVADRIVDPSDPRLKLVKETNGNTLEISLAEEEDAGDYFCQVSTYNPIEIKHSVRKLKVHELILIEFAMWIYPIQIAKS